MEFDEPAVIMMVSYKRFRFFADIENGIVTSECRTFPLMKGRHFKEVADEQFPDAHIMVYGKPEDPVWSARFDPKKLLASRSANEKAWKLWNSGQRVASEVR